MIHRNWKRIQPSSLRDALRLCKDHALEKKRYSVERIADLTQPLQARLARNGYYEAASQCADIIALAMGADPR